MFGQRLSALCFLVAGRTMVGLLFGVATVVLVGGCGGGGALAGGSTPLGGMCTGSNECAAVSGKVVECICTDQGNKPICVADAQEGENCAPTGNFQPICAPGKRCVGNSTSPGVLTATCLVPAKDGAACSPSPGCEEPDYCDAGGHCVRGQANLGDPCSWPQWSSCRAPYICDLFSGACAAPANIGARCELKDPGSRSSCVAGAGCDGIVCVALKPDRADCVYDEECVAAYCGLSGCGRASSPGVLFGCGL